MPAVVERTHEGRADATIVLDDQEAGHGDNVTARAVAPEADERDPGGPCDRVERRSR
ncbi:hypothetical protein GCM10027080_22750 [Pedococcus soli]